MKSSPLIPRHSSLFILGREAELCFAELETVLSVVDPAATIQKLSTDVALVQHVPSEAEGEVGRAPSVARQSEVGRAPSVAPSGEVGPTGSFDPAWWIRRLGGTRLIARVLDVVPTISTEAIHAVLDEAVREVALSSSAISVAERRKLLQELKQLRPTLRYRENHDAYLASGLSERLIRREDGAEVLLIKSEETPGVGHSPSPGVKSQWIIAQVVAVQDTRAWTERDRGLPAPDPVAGMLPPKLARIMVNLAEPVRRDSAILLDPFCGSGQIPIEALRLGWTVTATDLDPKSVERTKTNLAWVQELSADAAKQRWSAFPSDITQLADQFLQSGSIDAIVTEPYLGPPLKLSSAVPSTRVLERVAVPIRAAFEAGRTLIRSGGRLVIVIPMIAGQRIAQQLDDSVHSGYTLRATLHYSRPDSRVEREICVFDRT